MSNPRPSPPSRHARLADFDAILRRSQSVDESDESDEEIMIGEQQLSQGRKRRKVMTEKVVNDCIHGTIRLPPAAIAIIDTATFQRLRDIKQTGTCSLVFPNATHSRFQHSLGVAHLAEKFAKELQQRADLKDLIDDKDVLCVMLAGLCHDLGHGPYSHLWETFLRESGIENCHHEDTSIAMLDRLLEENNLRPKLRKLGDLDEKDIVFVKELIVGPLDDQGKPDHVTNPNAAIWPYKGRGEEKSFLYEIVANKTSGIDVDKWDYFLRDDYYLKIGTVFDYERFMFFCQVHKTDDKEKGIPERKRICLRDKEAENLKNMFNDRSRLHKNGYQHRITLIVDRMLVDAWKLADPFVKIIGSNGKVFSLSSSCQDPEAHEKLTDEYVKFKIMEQPDPELEPARELLRRVQKRDFYKVVGGVNLLKAAEPFKSMELDKILENLVEFMEEHKGTFGNLTRSDLAIVRKKVDVGMKMAKMNFFFFNKKECNQKVHIKRSEASSIMSKSDIFCEEVFILCTKENRRKVDHSKLTMNGDHDDDEVIPEVMAARNLVAQWKAKNGLVETANNI